MRIKLGQSRSVVRNPLDTAIAFGGVLTVSWCFMVFQGVFKGSEILKRIAFAQSSLRNSSVQARRVKMVRFKISDPLKQRIEILSRL